MLTLCSDRVISVVLVRDQYVIVIWLLCYDDVNSAWLLCGECVFIVWLVGEYCVSVVSLLWH